MARFPLSVVDGLSLLCLVLVCLSPSVQSSSSLSSFQRGHFLRKLSSPLGRVEGAVRPSAIWEHDIPTAVALSVDGLSLFAGLSFVRNPNLLVRSDLRGRIDANVSLVPNLPITRILPSLHSLFVSVADGSIAYLVEVALANFTQVNSFEVPARFRFTGVDQLGHVLLMEDSLTPLLATVDARTGAQLASYDGGLTLELAGSALSPKGDLLFSLNYNGSAMMFVAAIRSDNSLAYTFSLPSITEFIVGAAIDASGKYAYAVYVTQLPHNFSGTVVIAQFELETGAQLATTSLDFASYYDIGPISPAPRSTDVYLLRTLQDGAIQRSSILFLHGTNATAVPVSTRGVPFIEGPSQVATVGRGMHQKIYVALNDVELDFYPPRFLQLDSTGKLLASYTVETEIDHCGPEMPFQGIAVSASGTVYFPLCNGSLLLLNDRQQVVGRLDVTGVWPVMLRSMAPSADDSSVWIANDATRAQVSLYNLSSGAIIRNLTASPSCWFVDVKLGSDGSVWAVDNNGSAIVHWDADGRLLNSFSYVSQAGFMSLISLAVDHTHDRLLVTANLVSWDGTAVINSTLLWLSTKSGAVLQTFVYGSDEVGYGVAVAEDGSAVYAPSTTLGLIYYFEQGPPLAARVRLHANSRLSVDRGTSSLSSPVRSRLVKKLPWSNEQRV